MLSAKYHIIYWLASVAAAVTYRLIPTFQWHERLFQSLLYPLLADKLFFLWQGPKQERTDTWSWRSCWYFVSTAFLLVSLGTAVEAFCKDELELRQVGFTHVLLAFSTLGCLESVRQNVSR